MKSSTSSEGFDFGGELVGLLQQIAEAVVRPRRREIGQ
jgi:hypothetical protein